MRDMTIDIIEFEGKSGTRYPFTLYGRLPRFNKRIACVYMVLTRIERESEQQGFRFKHIGNTENFDQDAETRENTGVFAEGPSIYFAILPLKNEAHRKQVAMDLFKQHMQALGDDFLHNIGSLMNDLDAIE